jgi:hypothetical protein
VIASDKSEPAITILWSARTSIWQDIIIPYVEMYQVFRLTRLENNLAKKEEKFGSYSIKNGKKTKKKTYYFLKYVSKSVGEHFFIEI